MEVASLIAGRLRIETELTKEIKESHQQIQVRYRGKRERVKEADTVDGKGRRKRGREQRVMKI